MGLWNKIFGKAKSSTGSGRSVKRTLLNLQVGDIVQYDLLDYYVVGLIIYNDRGYKWSAYQMEAEGKRIWLAVEQDDALEVGIYEPVKLDMGDKLPLPDKISYKGKTFYLDEEGEAAIVEVMGEAGAAAGQRIKYWEYEDESEDYALSIEQWGGDLEVSYGYYVHPREFNIIAGS